MSSSCELAYFVVPVADADLHLLEDVLTRCIDDYAYSERLVKRQMTPLQYFRYLDRDQPQHFYFAVKVDDPDLQEDPPFAGFVRFAFVDAPPSFHRLKGDGRFCELDEIYVERNHRGRGAFAYLVDAVRRFSLRQGVEFVYCRVGNPTLARHFRRYGLQPLPIYSGRLRDLRLPAPAERRGGASVEDADVRQPPSKRVSEAGSALL